MEQLYSLDKLKQLKIPELKKILSERGLTKSGKKEDLIDRILKDVKEKEGMSKVSEQDSYSVSNQNLDLSTSQISSTSHDSFSTCNNSFSQQQQQQQQCSNQSELDSVAAVQQQQPFVLTQFSSPTTQQIPNPQALYTASFPGGAPPAVSASPEVAAALPFTHPPTHQVQQQHAQSQPQTQSFVMADQESALLQQVRQQAQQQAHQLQLQQQQQQAQQQQPITSQMMPAGMPTHDAALISQQQQQQLQKEQQQILANQIFQQQQVQQMISAQQQQQQQDQSHLISPQEQHETTLPVAATISNVAPQAAQNLQDNLPSDLQEQKETPQQFSNPIPDAIQTKVQLQEDEHLESVANAAVATVDAVDNADDANNAIQQKTSNPDAAQSSSAVDQSECSTNQQEPEGASKSEKKIDEEDANSQEQLRDELKDQTENEESRPTEALNLEPTETINTAEEMEMEVAPRDQEEIVGMEAEEESIAGGETSQKADTQTATTVESRDVVLDQVRLHEEDELEDDVSKFSNRNQRDSAPVVDDAAIGTSEAADDAVALPANQSKYGELDPLIKIRLAEMVAEDEDEECEDYGDNDRQQSGNAKKASHEDTNKEQQYISTKSPVSFSENMTMNIVVTVTNNNNTNSVNGANADDEVMTSITTSTTTRTSTTMPPVTSSSEKTANLQRSGAAKEINVIGYNVEVPKRSRPIKAAQLADPTRFIKISNLMRPFTHLQLKSMLEHCSGGAVNDICLNKIKSVALVTFDSAQAAQTAREQLDGSIWKMSKVLDCEFVTENEANPTSSASTTAAAAAVIEGAAIKEETHHADKQEKEKEKQTNREDAERTKDSAAADSSDMKNARKRKISSNETNKEEAKEEMMKRFDDNKQETVKLLEDLFKKTTTAPGLYWLPLTESQIKERDQKLEEKRMKRRKENESAEETKRLAEQIRIGASDNNNNKASNSSHSRGSATREDYHASASTGGGGGGARTGAAETTHSHHRTSGTSANASTFVSSSKRSSNQHRGDYYHRDHHAAAATSSAYSSNAGQRSSARH